MTTGSRAEICVLGAGPAGATLAARLARLGHDVAVVDRDAIATAQVGESLSPGVLPMLDDLGVAAAVDAAGFVRAPRARVRWRSGDREHPTPAGRGGLVVDRPRFDAILRAAACDAGARLLSAARAGRPRRVPGGWLVPLPGGSVHAGLIADATGRRRLTGGRRRATGARTMALHTTWTPVSAEPQSCVDVLEQGWLWGAHRPDGAFRAMAFVDPQVLDGRDGVDGRYRELVGTSSLFAGLLRGARPGPVQVCDATAHVVDDPIADDLVRVGDAALALDPLSACGVQVAMQTAVAAAAAVHTMLTPHGDRAAAHRYYRDLLVHTSARHAATATALYTEHDVYPGQAFWRRRVAEVPAASAEPRPARLRALLAHPVRLDPDAQVAPVPCLVGDEVRMHRALTHPMLDRPVAFLGHAPLAGLLDVLPTAPDLAAAVHTWDATTGGRGLQIAAWLANRGLLCPATA